MTDTAGTSAPDLAVIIPAFNCAPLLDRQLSAIAAQQYEGGWEVLVGDNGSTDTTPEVVSVWRERGLAVRRVDASARRGPAAARNIAAAEAAVEGAVAAFAFTDADDEVAADWLRACASGLSGADLVVGSLDYHLMSGDGVPVPQDPWPRQFRYLPAGLGANLAIRRDVFEALGGFDETLTVGEDIDLCWRAQLAGYRLVYCAAALVHKSDRSTMRERRRQWFAYGRGDPLLYKRFRGSGMSRAWSLTLKTWAWIILNVPSLLSPRRRPVWWQVGCLRAGRIVGSIEHRVLYL